MWVGAAAAAAAAADDGGGDGKGPGQAGCKPLLASLSLVVKGTYNGV